MFVLIEKRLGIRLPLATLFQNPTVRTLASKIDKTAQLSDWNSLVPMRISGSRPPLFLVHGAEGNVLLYRNIAEYLGDDQPVYGLQSQGLDGTELTGVTIESIARQYIKEIRSVQSSGPYYLGGYCLGGTIAFEIAQQLRQAGESIALVALLETYNLKSRPPVSIALKLLRKVQNIYFQSGNLMLSRGSSRFFAEKVRVELSRFKVQCEILRSRVFAKFGSNGRTKYTHIQIKEVNHRAQEAYNPRPYDGRVLVCRSKAYYLGFKDAQYGWGDIATQGVQVIELSHFPHGSLNRPFVRTLAHVLRDEIDKTLDDAEGLSGSTVTVDEGIALEV
jgi:thioesterase domain-containing protein